MGSGRASSRGFRLDHDVIDQRTRRWVPSRPATATHRREWDQANAALERAQRQLGREPPARDRGVDLGIG